MMITDKWTGETGRDAWFGPSIPAQAQEPRATYDPDDPEWND